MLFSEAIYHVRVGQEAIVSFDHPQVGEMLFWRRVLKALGDPFSVLRFGDTARGSGKLYWLRVFWI